MVEEDDEEDADEGPDPELWAEFVIRYKRDKEDESDSKEL
jgi:hypothetical protein